MEAYLASEQDGAKHTRLLKYVLLNNYIEFAGNLYKQTCGTAMGTSCAPPYAQLFLALLIERHLLVGDNPNLLLFKRFIDDIFIVYRGTRSELDAFLAQYNTYHPRIQVKWEVSTTSVPFLDIVIFKSGGRLQTRTHQKV
ncbi:MAG: hypothetical protein AAFU83_04635 [Bacteroidota bacterium]